MGDKSVLGSLKELKTITPPFLGRHDGRPEDALRPLNFERNYLDHVPGSVLVSFGKTRVLCTVSIDDRVPRWLQGQGRGWLTAEYSMLPASTATRKDRDISRGKLDGRTSEIQRLIGRALRNIVDFKSLGEKTIWIDCDVIQADGGTRTSSICGAYVALVDACRDLEKRRLISKWPLRDSLQAISVGIVQGTVLLDLDYQEDSQADVDLNLVMTGAGNFVELQGTGEKVDFSDEQLQKMLSFGRKGCEQIASAQKKLFE